MKNKRITAKIFINEYLAKLNGNTTKLLNTIDQLINSPNTYKRLFIFQEIALKMNITPRRLANKVKKWHNEGKFNYLRNNNTTNT